jgi:UDP-N-acetylmuramoyl-tripeptide--D-alanyl-D-alanine ligase
MLELGDSSPELHANLIKPLKRNRIDLIFTAGNRMKCLSDALPSAMRGGNALSADKILPRVLAAIRAGDVVMVKGSAGSRMGPIVRAVAALGKESDQPYKRLLNESELRRQHAL